MVIHQLLKLGDSYRVIYVLVKTCGRFRDTVSVNLRVANVIPVRFPNPGISGFGLIQTFRYMFVYAYVVSVCCHTAVIYHAHIHIQEAQVMALTMAAAAAAAALMRQR